MQHISGPLDVKTNRKKRNDQPCPLCTIVSCVCRIPGSKPSTTSSNISSSVDRECILKPGKEGGGANFYHFRGILGGFHPLDLLFEGHFRVHSHP